MATPPGQRTVSRICLESTAPLGPVHITTSAPDGGPGYLVWIVVGNSRLVMAEDDILVADGLIRSFEVASGPGEICQVKVTLEHEANPDKSDVPGNPHLTRFDFSRKPLEQLFSGRCIGIDPGHGGRDRGFKGPVNLLEKDVVLAIARELERLLASCGAIVVMTRQGDLDLDLHARREILGDGGAEVCIQVHAAGSSDPNHQEYKIYTQEECPSSRRLADIVKDSLLERMGIDTKEPSPLPLWGSRAATIPSVRVEPLCITHYVDEANFRAPLFRKRIAQALFNGIHRYFLTAKLGELPAI